MASYRQIPWPRILAEGIAIVVSILLAFLIQAWWEGRQSSDDERVVLEALHIDLNQKKSRLVQDQRLSETIIETGTKLLATTADTDSSLDQESLDELIGNLLWYNPESNWDSAPMNSLLMGGDVSLIDNTTLIQQLASLQVTMNRARLIMRVDANFHENRLMPFLVENADLVQIFLTLGSSPSGTEGEYSFPNIENTKPRNHSDLLSRDDFRGIVIWKMDAHKNAQLYNYPNLGKQLDEVLALVKEELGK